VVRKVHGRGRLQGGGNLCLAKSLSTGFCPHRVGLGPRPHLSMNGKVIDLRGTPGKGNKKKQKVTGIKNLRLELDDEEGRRHGE